MIIQQPLLIPINVYKMNLASKIFAVGALSLKLLTGCSTTDNSPEYNYLSIEGSQRMELEKEIEEYRNLDIFPFGRNNGIFAWNYNLAGEVRGYYKINILPENPPEPRLCMELIRIREDKDRNGLDEKDKWFFENKRYKEFKWQRDRNSSPNYFIMIKDNDKKYYYTLQNAGLIRATFKLKKIQWERDFVWQE